MVDLSDELAARFPCLDVVSVASDTEARVHWPTIEILVTLGHLMTREQVHAMPRLRWVQSLLAGVESLQEILAGTKILLTSASGIHGPQAAELVMTHMHVLSKDVGRLLDSKRERDWRPFTPRVLAHQTAAIVGLGVIGSATARLCAAHGMRVVGISDHVVRAECVERIFRRAELAEAVKEADFLVLALSYTPDVRHIINTGILARMKPTAYLINVSRGAVVDEEALIQALRCGAIAGAGLDVFSREPLPPDSPLWSLENVFVTPHVAGQSERYGERVLTVIDPNMRAYLAGDVAAMRNRVTV
jgi:phosphoglycerate dehydrogenase-like enzyme